MTLSGDATQASSELHTELQRFIDSAELPGLVYLMERDGVQYAGAFGHATRSGTPMSMDSIFRIASLSKPIAGVATLKLIENGTLRLDQPVESLLPELAELRVLRSVDGTLDDTVPLDRSITIEDLLTFRMGTGIVLAAPGTYPVQRAMDAAYLGIGPPDPAGTPAPDAWIRTFAELPLVHQPGTEWMYVTSSEVLGVLLARATGMSLSDVFRKLVFDPLEMVDTGFYVPAQKTGRFTSQFVRDPETGELCVTDPPVDGHWNVLPAFPSAGGGLVSTIDDFATFARMLLNRGVHAGSQYLSESSIHEMTRNHLTEQQRRNGEVILSPGNGWGYCVGVRVEKTDVPGNPGSYGWNGGFGTTWLNDPGVEMIAILFTQLQFESAALPSSARRFLELAYRI